MDTVTPFDWGRLFVGEDPPLYYLEIILRVFLIYTFTVFMLRFMGKRGQRQMTPFELLLVIALGSATGDSMFYPEVPIFYAWLIISVVVGLDRMLGVLQFRFRHFSYFLEGRPRLMIEEGKILKESLRKERLRPEELLALLRELEIENTGEVQYAFLERTGSLGLFRHTEETRAPGESTYPKDMHTKDAG